MAVYGAVGGVGAVDFSLPPQAAAQSNNATTSATRAGTATIVLIRVVSAIQYRFAPMAARTITASVSPTIASIKITYGMTARVAQTDNHARTRAHPAPSATNPSESIHTEVSFAVIGVRTSYAAHDPYFHRNDPFLNIEGRCATTHEAHEGDEWPSSWLSAVIQCAKRCDIVCRQTGSRRGADVVGGTQPLAVIAEIAWAIV